MLDQDDYSSSCTDCESTGDRRDETTGRTSTPSSHRIKVTVKSDWVSSSHRNDCFKETERVGTPETDATTPTLGNQDTHLPSWTSDSHLPHFSTPPEIRKSLLIEQKNALSETSSSSMTSGSGHDEDMSNAHRCTNSRPESPSSQLRNNLFPESPGNDSFEGEFTRARSFHFDDYSDRRESFPRSSSDGVPGDPSQWRLRSRRSMIGSEQRRQSTSTVTLDLNYEECEDSDEFFISSRSRRGSKKISRKYRRRRSSRTNSISASQQLSTPEPFQKKCIRLTGSRLFPWIMVLCGLVSVCITFLAGHSMIVASELDALEHPKHMSVLFRQLDTDSADGATKTRAIKKGLAKIKRVHSKHTSASLRGGMAHDTVAELGHGFQDEDGSKKHENIKKHKKHPKKDSKVAATTKDEKVKTSSNSKAKKNQHGHKHSFSHLVTQSEGRFVIPTASLSGVSARFSAVDPQLYRTPSEKRPEAQRRMVSIDSDVAQMKPRTIELYPAKFTDSTQLYSILDSSDERMTTMELRKPLSEGECVPMQEWQTSFHPSCNSMHELDLANIGEDNGDDFNLFGTKGYWRNAWRVDTISGHQSKEERDTTVLKTLK